MSEVAAWAKQNGGLQGVRSAISTGSLGADTQSLSVALHYIEREELLIAQRHANKASTTAADNAVAAARRYALYAAVACVIAVTAAVAALTAVFTR